MIHLNRVLVLHGLMANIVHGVIIDSINFESSVIVNNIPWVSICIFNHHYVGSYLHPPWLIDSI